MKTESKKNRKKGSPIIKNARSKSVSTDRTAPSSIPHPDFRLIFEHLPAVSFVVQPSDSHRFRIVAANAAQRSIPGLENDIVGRYLDEIIPAEIAETTVRHYQECMNAGLPIEYEEYVNAPWERHFHTHLAPIKDETGNVTLIVGITHDITGFKNTSRELLENEERYRFLVSKIPDIVLVHVGGRIVFVNEAVTAISGYAPHEVIGKSIFGFLPHDEGDRIEKINQSRSNLESVPDVYETAIIHRDERRIDVEVRVLSIDYQKQDARLVVITDISVRKRAIASEERFRNLAELLPETVYETDEKGVFTFVNSTGLETFGFVPDDLNRGLGIQDVFPPEEHHRVRENRANTIDKKKIQRIEYLACKKDGSKIPVMVHTVPIIIDGKPMGTRGIVVDISERKAIEETLLLNEQRLETLLRISQMSDATTEQIILSVLDEGILLTKSETGFLALVHQEKDQIQICACKNRNSRNSCSAQHSTKISENPLLSGLLSDNNANIANTVNKDWSKTVEGFSPERNMLSVPVIDEGKVVAIISVGDKHTSYDDTDIRQLTLLMNEFFRIIQHKSNQREIADEREKIAVTLRSIENSVITIDHENRIILINHSAIILIGYNDDEYKNRKIDEMVQLVYTDTGKPYKSITQIIGTGERPVSINEDISIISRSGKRTPVEINTAPLRGSKNIVTGAVIVLRDMSEKRKMEESRMKAIKLESVGLLAGGIAHDFNNILTSILGNISLARTEIDSSDRIYEILVEAEKASIKAKFLTQQLLTLAKGGEPVKRNLPIADLVRDCTDFVLRGSNVKPEYDIPASFPEIDIDEGQIIQVMHNLVLNAKQAMPDGGIVKVTGRFIDDISEKISTTESGHFIMMSIEDSGTGIPADDLPRIFDPYFTTKTDGHGLGLATTYAIIRKHGGYIEAKSESGKTCFTFFLPAKRSAADTMSAQRHTEKTRGGKILVLEDETSICSFLKRFFDRFGYLGTITTDGNETITAYRTAMENNDPFDCVLLDLTIPGGMGGRIAMNELLKINPSVKGIVCSGYSNDSAMSSYREHGFIGCITKPYHVEELHELLQTVMR